MTREEIEILANSEKLNETDLETKLKDLKLKGATILLSIIFVRINQNISLNEAKRVVVESSVWQKESPTFIQHQQDMWEEAHEDNSDSGSLLKTIIKKVKQAITHK